MVPMLDTYTILLVNGWYYEENQKPEGLPAGTAIGSIRKIANEEPEVLRNWLNRLAGLSNDPLVALNTAFAQDGFFLHVPKGVILEKPIQVIQPAECTRTGICHPAEPDHCWENTVRRRSSSAIIPGMPATFCRTALLKFLRVVTRWLISMWCKIRNNQANSVNSAFIRQEANSNLLTCMATLHGGMIRNNLNISLDGEYAEAHLFGMSFTDKKQHIDNFTNVEHNKPNCISNQLYKNVLNEDSSGAFAGRIHVARDAQKTNAFQRNNNVLLTDRAKMYTKPQLIIDADDVKCSHGATIGQIDEEALFYLRAPRDR